MSSLLIDSSNQPLSVALINEGNLLVHYQSNLKKNHSSQLMPIIELLMKQAELTPKDLTEIIVANGPGSYTGLRIGITTAKTLAYSLDIPLYEVSSLKSLAKTCDKKNVLIVPVIDARREYVFAGIYQNQDEELETIGEDEYIHINDLINKLESFNLDYVFVGNDTLKLSKLESKNCYPNLPNASYMYNLKTDPIKNVHDLKPNYLKLSEAEQNWKNNHSK